MQNVKEVFWTSRKNTNISNVVEERPVCSFYIGQFTIPVGSAHK